MTNANETTKTSKPRVNVQGRATVKRAGPFSKRLIVTMPDGYECVAFSPLEAARQAKRWAEAFADEARINVLLIDWDGVTPPDSRNVEA
jgi:hypothetical protein